MPVQGRLRLDFDISVDLHLAGKSKRGLVANSCEERQRVERRHRELLVKALMRNVLESLFDQDATTGADTQAEAVQVIVGNGVKLDSCANGFAAQVRANRNFHGFLFVDECDCWHDERTLQNNRGIS